MKKILTSLLIIITCFTLIGCGNKAKNEPDIKNVTMIIKEDTLTRTGATVIITDINEKHYYYGEPFRIEKKENGTWEELEIVGAVNFNEPAYHVDKNNQLELKQDWSNIYGELKDGEYRLVKDVCVNDGCTKKKEFSVEFTINSSLFNEVNPEIQEKIKDTKRIDVYSFLSHDKKVKTVDNEEEVKNMINLLVRATKNTDKNHTTEGHMIYLKLYDGENTFLTDIYVWKNNAIGFTNNKEYKLDTSFIIKMYEE